VQRIPEPELMDDPAQARAYAEADFAEANGIFVQAFIAHFGDRARRVLDLGCGPADITVQLARRLPGAQLIGLDGSPAMLALARQRLVLEGLEERIELVEARLGAGSGAQAPAAEWADAVVSNSLLHHLAEPAELWRTVRRLGAPGAAVLVMDLHRPVSDAQTALLVERYAADAPAVLRRDFENSLRAAYTAEEVRQQLAAAGLAGFALARPSDRHWLAYGWLSGGSGGGSG